MSLRRRHLQRLRDESFDTLVIGGGINGAVSAASLAGRGASVAIIDRGDFGSFTSQASSNLVWGGFKYLENYELLLVWKLCRSRNRLMKAYPDNIEQIGFYATLDETSPYKPWFAGLGALGYWIIGMFGTKRPRLLSTKHIEREEPAVDTSAAIGGIEYYDGLLIDNDARFVFSFVRAAIDAGAVAANYVELVSAERSDGRWIARLRDTDTGEEFTTTATTIVNAAGPFVDEVNQEWGLTTDHRIVYSKGIHLVVPRLTTTDHHHLLTICLLHGVLQGTDHFRTIRLKVGISTDNNILTARQWPANRLPGFPAHDDGFVHRCLFKVLQFCRQMPRHFASESDSTILTHRCYQSYLLLHAGVVLYLCKSQTAIGAFIPG